jgi:imidazolonepropionase-like amidohydrolase
MRFSKYLLFILAVLIGMGTGQTTLAQLLAVRGETIYTMAGQPIQNGVVIIRDGKIEQIGQAAQVTIPAGYKILTAKVVTPGLIDAHTVVGLAGYLNQPHDQMQLDASAAMQPELRAIDAYNSRERLVEWLRNFGITTIHTGHGPGALISGQTMIVKTTEVASDSVILAPMAMIASSLGTTGLFQGGRSPGTKSKAIAMLRGELIKAQEYKAKWDAAPVDKKPERNLHWETMAAIIKGQVPLLVTVNTAPDILSTLRLAQEFNIKVVLDGAAESYLVTEQIKAAGVPVILHATMARANGDSENLSIETASILRKAGIPVALQSGYEGYVPKTRVILFEAALTTANGLSMAEALATITIDAAKILGIANRVGSLERGKDGDLALFDGDPFEYTSHVIGVVINGQVVSERERYQN